MAWQWSASSGATSRQVLAIYVLQAAAMGLAGAAAGATLGIALQFLVPRALGDFLPVDASCGGAHPIPFQRGDTPVPYKRALGRFSKRSWDEFIKDFREEYKDKTVCADDFRVAECKNAPKEKTNTGPASGGNPNAQPPSQPQQPQPPQQPQQPAPTPENPKP